MTYKTFAAINVGSGEVSMKIYEISPKTGIREIDYVRYYIELGSDTYTKGYIEYDLVRELCDVLEGFSTKMEEYRVDSYLALGSSALIEASNCELIVDQIRVRTGLKVETIDNAQQRFLLLKSVARGMRNFEQLIDDGAAIVDMGSGSLQITIYDEGRLIYTQNRFESHRLRQTSRDRRIILSTSWKILSAIISIHFQDCLCMSAKCAILLQLEKRWNPLSRSSAVTAGKTIWNGMLLMRYAEVCWQQVKKSCQQSTVFLMSLQPS